MARTTGGGASRNVRKAQPSAEEMQRAIGRSFGSRAMGGVGQLFGNQYEGLPVASSYGEFDEIISVIHDTSKDSGSTMEYFMSDRDWDDRGGNYDNLAGLSRATDPYTRQFYQLNGLKGDEVIPGYRGAQNEEDDSPAPLTVVPTSTSNPQRPRTVAAGYDKDEEKITVVFRDGTFYNYYEVNPNEWATFKATVSKGQYIYRFLDFKPRGPADVSSISQTARKAFYKIARGSQIHFEGKQKNSGKTSKPKKR